MTGGFSLAQNGDIGRCAQPRGTYGNECDGSGFLNQGRGQGQGQGQGMRAATATAMATAGKNATAGAMAAARDLTKASDTGPIPQTFFVPAATRNVGVAAGTVVMPPCRNCE